MDGETSLKIRRSSRHHWCVVAKRPFVRLQTVGFVVNNSATVQQFPRSVAWQRCLYSHRLVFFCDCPYPCVCLLV